MTAESTGRPSDDLRGRHVGSYRIVTELGEGGMGTVYFAEHEVLGRRAAIKVLKPHAAQDESAVARFFDEARAVNDIRHPNIVDITDFGEVDGRPFYVMELLEGETLAERLEHGEPLDMPTIRDVVDQIARALDAAHRRGVIHRDLKPENIFLVGNDDRPDAVKVLDFGIAKLTGKGGTHHTAPGIVIGTPAYMSPEQCRGDRDIDTRSDIYALGIVVYEMLAGRPPFVENGFGAYVLAHVAEQPTPLSELVPDISESVEAVVLEALAKHPEDRHASVEVFRLAFDAAVTGRTRAEEAAKDEQSKKRVAHQTKQVGDKLTDIIHQRLVAGKLQLPSMPLIALKSLQMLQSNDVNLPTVARELERDPLLASQLLRVVNSPVYGGRGRIHSLAQAISRLGIEPLKMLLLQTSARSVFQSRDPRIQQSFRAIWEHCLAVGMVARELADRLPGNASRDEAYLAGLLHDIGKPVVGAFLLEVERQLIEDLGAPWMDESLWFSVVDKSHQTVGKTIVDRWNLPKSVRDAVSHFHAYGPGGASSIPNIVRYANALVRREGIDLGAIDPDETTDSVTRGRDALHSTEEFERRVTHRLRFRIEEITGEQPRSSAFPPAIERESAAQVTPRVSRKHFAEDAQRTPRQRTAATDAFSTK